VTTDGSGSDEDFFVAEDPDLPSTLVTHPGENHLGPTGSFHDCDKGQKGPRLYHLAVVTEFFLYQAADYQLRDLVVPGKAPDGLVGVCLHTSGDGVDLHRRFLFSRFLSLLTTARSLLSSSSYFIL